MHWPLNVFGMKNILKPTKSTTFQWKPILENTMLAFKWWNYHFKDGIPKKYSIRHFAGSLFLVGRIFVGPPWLPCQSGPSCLPPAVVGNLFAAQLIQPAMLCQNSQRGRQPKVATWRGNQSVVSVFLSNKKKFHFQPFTNKIKGHIKAETNR